MTSQPDFTDKAWQIIERATGLAIQEGADAVKARHLFQGCALEEPRLVREGLQRLGITEDQIASHLMQLAPDKPLPDLVSGPYELIGELLTAEQVVVIDRAGVLTRQGPAPSATDGKIAPEHLWTGVCLAINEFRDWLLSRGWAEAELDRLMTSAKSVTPADTAGDSISEWALDQLCWGMADILDVLSRTGSVDVEELAKRLLGEFDAVVEACESGEWVRSLDTSIPSFELPLTHHKRENRRPDTDEDSDDLPNDGQGRSRWRKVDNSWIGWQEAHHDQEQFVEHWHLEKMVNEHWDRLKRAYVLIVPGLVGHAYRATPGVGVPQRYYWTFVTGYATEAQSIFYRSLSPDQTAALCRHGFRSGREDEFADRAWAIPSALPHVLNLIPQDDEVVLRRLRIHDFRKFGVSHELLAALIDTTEQLFLKLGRRPFDLDDNRLHLTFCHKLAMTIFDVADDWGPSSATRSYLPRLRGLHAQLELQWPRVTLTGANEDFERTVVRGQTDPETYDGHPADWIQSALVALGDSRELTMLPRADVNRLESALVYRWHGAPGFGRLDRLVKKTLAPTCGTCGGSGLVRCGKCDGKGRLPADSVTRSMQAKWKKDPSKTSCFCCAATGRWMCWTCQGSGVQPTPDIVR